MRDPLKPAHLPARVPRQRELALLRPRPPLWNMVLGEIQHRQRPAQRPAVTTVTVVAIRLDANVEGLAQRPDDILPETKAVCRCAPAAAAPDELPLITARQAQQRSSVVVSHHTSKGRDVGPVRDTPVLLLRKLLYCDSPTPQPTTRQPFAARCRLLSSAKTRRGSPLSTLADPTKQQANRCCTRGRAEHERPRSLSLSCGSQPRP